jgi:hypothetical protein
MSTDFKFNAAEVVPQSEVVVDAAPKLSRVVLSRSDAERIAVARAIGIQHTREHNAPNAEYGMGFSPSHYQDFGFSSAWLASRICFLAELISTTLAGKDVRSTWREAFDPRTGIFEDDTFGWVPFSLADLQKAFLARIHELGLSHALLEEFATTIHSIESDRKFYNMGFDERMATFAVAKA